MTDKKNKDMAQALDQMPEETTEFVRELSDEELEQYAGGGDVLERVKPPSNDRPPIEAPILNPFS